MPLAGWPHGLESPSKSLKTEYGLESFVNLLQEILESLSLSSLPQCEQ